MARPKKNTEVKSEQIQTSEPTNNTSVIVPLVKFDGDRKPHKYQEFVDNEKTPIVKAVGYHRLPGTNEYVAYIYHIKGKEVVKIEVGEPNLRPIASDEAKVNFVQTFEAAE